MWGVFLRFLGEVLGDFYIILRGYCAFSGGLKSCFVFWLLLSPFSFEANLLFGGKSRIVSD